MTKTITQLTPEQEALIPVYREKWRAIAFSTEALDPTKASDAIKAAYSLVGREKPAILFCSSPYTALKSIIDIQLSSQFGGYLEDLRGLYFDPYFQEMFTFSKKILDNEGWIKRWYLSEALKSKFENQYWKHIIINTTKIKSNNFWKFSKPELNLRLKQSIVPLNYVGNYTSGKLEFWKGSVDFCISVLKVHYNPVNWAVIQSLVSECGWIFPFEKIAIICGRPLKIMLDSEERLHAEGEPAVLFADGFCIWANHGLILPEKYGKLNPSKWPAEWIAKEQDINLKYYLIKAISPPEIAHLTSEQESRISVIRDKWRNYAFLTEPIDRHKAKEAVKAVYTALGEPEPEVLFCDSPLMLFETAARYALFNDWFPCLWEEMSYVKYAYKLSYQMFEELERKLALQIESQLLWQLQSELVPEQRTLEQMRSMRSQLEAELPKQLKQTKGQLLELLQLLFENESVWSYNQEISWYILMTKKMPNFMRFYGYMSPETCIQSISLIDFFITVLNLNHNSIKWSAFESLFQNCGSILALKKICVVSDRPRLLSFDNQSRLHAEGSPAIQFPDGWCIYAYHGVILPEKYGKLPPVQWQSEWLLSENNAELRRVLIQGIGYARICQKLQAVELDYWQEYTLLKIDSDVDVEPIYLLKMTCPTTGYIHALRVPPDVKSAREAIIWVNWGITPEEFSVQT